MGSREMNLYMKNSRTIAVLLLLTYLVVLTTGCSEVDFAKQESASGALGAAGSGDKGDDDALGQVNAGGGTNTTPGTPSTPGTPATPSTPTNPAPVYPKVQFIGPPCARGSNCVVQFKLDKAYPQAVDFDWKTDDTLYLTTAPAGMPVYAQPAVHYVSASGHTVFMPGETLKTVYIQNINPYNYEVTIGVRMRNCIYGGRIDSCQDYFR